MSAGRAIANMLTSHEAAIRNEHDAMWAAYDLGKREDAYHHWNQVVRLIKLRSPVVVDQMERAMGLTGAAPIRSNIDPFYRSPEWLELRYRILAKRGNRCECCGRGKADGVGIHVDHVKPRSKYPELALVETNLQVLCSECNVGKSNVDETDWRT